MNHKNKQMKKQIYARREVQYEVTKAFNNKQEGI